MKKDILFNFSGDEPSGLWVSMNDGVMGGLSSGQAKQSEKGMLFSGVLSLENNGGFSSIREQVQMDLSEYTGVYLRVRGDGRNYQLRLESDARLWGRSPVSFNFEFEAPAGEWVEVFVPFMDLQQSWRGRRLEGYAFNMRDIRMIGILLGDKKPGSFALEVSEVGAYSEADQSIL